MPLGLYLSVPFCRTKCSYCNFASDVFSRAIFARYVDRVCGDIEQAAGTAETMGAHLEREVDSIYFGGGTPTVLDITQLQRLFVTITQNFRVRHGAEITIECAPGTLTPAMLEALHGCGVNRVSLGVQSFVDQEAAAVGRLHKREMVLDDISRLRSAGIANINIDLIAGLPHQTAESWEVSLAQALASGVPHISVYMLEVDEDSRLGRELIAGGTRYHAHHVPDEDLVADMYLTACDRLEAAGVQQYEISNFARKGYESRHNLKYWTRQPYLGFGVDAHSMLRTTGAEALQDRAAIVGLKAHASTVLQGSVPGHEIPRVERHDGAADSGIETDAANLLGNNPSAGDTVEGHGFSPAVSVAQKTGFSPRGDSLRFATPDSLEGYLAAKSMKPIPVSQQAELEETFFLGLRLNRGIDLRRIANEFGEQTVADVSRTLDEFVEMRLLERQGDAIHLTSQGRLLSNEVFERFIKFPA